MIVGSKVDYDINDLYIPKDGKEDNNYQKSFSATLTVIVRDKEGNVIKRYKQKSHSPTSNFIGIMLPLTWYVNTGSSWTLTNTSNSTFSYAKSLSESSYQIVYPNNYTNYSVYIQNILVGSGSNNSPYSAYNLNAPISNGSGTGQLLYSSISTPSGITINGSQAYFIVSQSYANQSGATITVSEVGIEMRLQLRQAYGGGGSGNSILVWYDVLSSPISIGSGQSLVIYYTFSVNA